MKQNPEKRLVFLQPEQIRLIPSGNPGDRYRLLLLSQSIQENGVIIPVGVRPVGKDYELIYGRRRVEAARIAGVKTIPCLLYREADTLLLSAMENAGRRTDPLFYREWLNPLLRRYSPETLCTVFCLSSRELAQRKKIADMSEESFTRAVRCGLSFSQILHFCELSGKEADDYLSAVQNAARPSPQPADRETNLYEKLRSELFCGKRAADDPRFYINSIRQIGDRMRDGGIAATLTQSDRAAYTEIKIRIPKKQNGVQLSLLDPPAV